MHLRLHRPEYEIRGVIDEIGEPADLGRVGVVHETVEHAVEIVGRLGEDRLAVDVRRELPQLLSSLLISDVEADERVVQFDPGG